MTLSEIEPGLAFILPLITMLTKKPEMLLPDAFCEYTMQQNASAEARWGSGGVYSVPPDLLTSFNGVASRRGGGEGDMVRKREENGRKGEGGKGNWNRAADWLRQALNSCDVLRIRRR